MVLQTGSMTDKFPETSCMKEISLVEWDGLSHAAKQALLKSKDVLIYDPRAEARSFNKDAILRITESMAKFFTVHGMFQINIYIIWLNFHSIA